MNSSNFFRPQRKIVMSSRRTVRIGFGKVNPPDTNLWRLFARDSANGISTPVLCLEPSEKNGFSIMAVSCLLIEAYETFRQGWPSSDNKSALAFCYFFDREDHFEVFRGHLQGFYEHVRCGILHQGETTGGWKLTRADGKPLFEHCERTVHASKFHALLVEVIDEYCALLNREPTTSDTWRKFKRKLKATLQNCEK